MIRGCRQLCKFNKVVFSTEAINSAASPAPPKVAQQIYTQVTLTKMVLRHAQGEPMEKTLAWAEGECEGFMRS
jgi:hypothetical protein